MADEPPPLDFGDEDPRQDDEEEEQNPFEAPKVVEDVEEPQEQDESEPVPVPETDNTPQPAELSVEAVEERPHTDSEPPTLEPTVPDVQPVTQAETSAAVKPSEVEKTSAPSGDLFGEEEEDETPKPKPSSVVKAPIEEEDVIEEHEQGFEMTITVGDPEKSGEGMGAFMTYKITTKTTLPNFKSPECMVRRRFSDFLGLYYRFAEKYLHVGRIIPPPPEKSVTGMTKVKFSKKEESGAAFIDRRRAALERYLNRLACHPVLSKDEILKDFLENPAELPKAKDTSAMSGAGFMRLVRNVGDSIQKMTGKKTDGDMWFEERQQEYEILDNHLRKLHNAIETMISARKELCLSTGVLVKNIAALSNAEENDSVSRALSRLSEVQERVEALHEGQISKDLFVFGETVKDYVALLGSIKESFGMRGKSHGSWMSTQKTLASKRDSEQKLTAAGKTEKLPQLKEEISEWEDREKQSQKVFEEMSKVLRREIVRFERERIKEFKEKFVSYLESLMQMQQELIRLWEGYLPDAQAID